MNEMNLKYRLPDVWVAKTSAMEEFANGATQVTIRLTGGREVSGVLLSDATYVIAVRGFDDLPFDFADIVDVFQAMDDKTPTIRDGWRFWDNWQTYGLILDDGKSR
jgi:hypothetical protein